MRKALVVIALILAVVLGWFVFRPDSIGEKPFDPVALEPISREKAMDELEPPQVEETPGARHVEQQPASEKLAPEPRATSVADDIELRGTIVAIDQKGGEHPREDGELELIAWKGQGGSGQHVLVHEGAWTARVTRGALIGISGAKLGGRSAVLEHETAGRQTRISIPDDGVVALRLRWLRTMRLFARNRDSKLDLADVTIVRAEGWPRMDYPHPGEFTSSRVLARSKPSPISIMPESNRFLAVHVGSPGHAWGQMKLDTAEGGDHFITLDSAGDLDLELVAERIDKSTLVRVRDLLGSVVAELDIRDRRKLALEGLPTGKLGVSAEIGNHWENPIVLAKSNVEVRAGERTHLVLTLSTAPADSSVAIAGEVVIPVEWEAKGFLFVVTLLDPPLGGRESIRRILSDDMKKDAERPGVWHWRLEGMQAGQYELDVWQFQYSIVLRVPETGLEDARIEVPKPCDARVRVIDAQNGAEAKVDKVLWNCRRPEPVRGGGSNGAEWDGESRSWKVRAPRGEIELHIVGQDYRQVSKVVELREGSNEIVLEVKRQYSVMLKLARTGTPIVWPNMVTLKKRPKEGGAVESCWGGGGAALLVTFDHPGVWIVTLPEISGYDTVPPFEVRVDPEQRLEQTIELMPKG